MLMSRGGNHTVDLVDFVVADHIPDGGIEAHDFKYRDRVTIDIRNQLLGNDSLQHHGKLNGNLSLLGRLKYIHNTADRVGCSGGMKTGEHKMPGLGGSHGSLDRFVITHFTEKDHVRTLAEGGAQRDQVTFRICTDFSLVDDAFVMSVHLLLFLLYTAYNKSYVTQNSAEYFAESVKEFTLNPAALKSARPKTYEAVKEAMDKLTDDRVAKVKKVYSMIWK